MIELARQYGRYGYRRIAALLRDAGWSVNDKRVERLWRLEGLKVPARQPKRGRLWLNDGSCVRLRAERPDHVWSYDFVHHRTHDGRAFRTLNVLDEFTRESLAIRVRRKALVSRRDRCADGPVHSAWPTSLCSIGQWPGVRGRGRPAMGHRGWCSNRLHRAGFALGERLHRVIQRPFPRRAARRRDLLFSEGGSSGHRAMASPLQHHPPAQQPGIPAPGSRNDRSAKLAVRLRSATPTIQLGGEATHALTFNLDQSLGADHPEPPAVSTIPFLAGRDVLVAGLRRRRQGRR